MFAAVGVANVSLLIYIGDADIVILLIDADVVNARGYIKRFFFLRTLADQIGLLVSIGRKWLSGCAMSSGLSM